MKVVLNDVEQTVPEGQLLEAFLYEAAVLSQKGIAVAVNYAVISKVAWKEHQLKENDQIMIITATAGG